VVNAQCVLIGSVQAAGSAIKLMHDFDIGIKGQIVGGVFKASTLQRHRFRPLERLTFIL
jgi:hypothetical protein